MYHVPYIGKCSYCYANSTAMLLGAIGEEISPSLIEVLTGVGLGAFLLKNTKIIFFSTLTGMPDVGISKALEILGFDYIEKVSQKPTPAPFEELKADLSNSPAVLGPLDAGFLTYNSEHKYLAGADHYILVYSINEEAHLHDPEGFPYVSLPLKQLALAWRAEDIFYRRGFYRYWTSPKRIHNPTEKEIYSKALMYFKSLYHKSAEEAARNEQIIGREAILSLANHIRKERASPEEIGQLTYFALKLGAKRAHDFARFFDAYDHSLADLKRKQAVLFGKCHTLAVMKKHLLLAKTLQQLANIEEKFRITLLAK